MLAQALGPGELDIERARQMGGTGVANPTPADLKVGVPSAERIPGRSHHQAAAAGGHPGEEDRTTTRRRPPANAVRSGQQRDRPGAEAKDPHRARDVLDTVLAEVFEGVCKPVTDLVARSHDR